MFLLLLLVCDFFPWAKMQSEKMSFLFVEFLQSWYQQGAHSIIVRHGQQTVVILLSSRRAVFVAMESPVI